MVYGGNRSPDGSNDLSNVHSLICMNIAVGGDNIASGWKLQDTAYPDFFPEWYGTIPHITDGHWQLSEALVDSTS